MNGKAVTPPTWIKHRRFDAQLEKILQHEARISNCGTITGCACGADADGWEEWAGHLNNILSPHHSEGP